VGGQRLLNKNALNVKLRPYKKGDVVTLGVSRYGTPLTLRMTIRVNKKGEPYAGVIKDTAKADAYRAKLAQKAIETEAKRGRIVSFFSKSKVKTPEPILPTKEEDVYENLVKDASREMVKSPVEDADVEFLENDFTRRAKEEMDGVRALMADMKGRDAYMEARNLKEELLKKLRMDTHENGLMVADYLDRLSKSSSPEIPDVSARGKRTLSALGKFVVAIGAFAALSGIAYGAVELVNFVR
jgi:hypothetical protein